jgi:hypothetical protein
VAQRLESRIAKQVSDVGLAAGEIVVDTQHIVPIAQQTLAQVRSEEPGAACHQHSLYAVAATSLHSRSIVWIQHANVRVAMAAGPVSCCRVTGTQSSRSMASGQVRCEL